MEEQSIPPMIKVSKTADLIQGLYKGKSFDGRIHASIGASSAGEECDRKIWLNYRWTYTEDKSPRMCHLLEEGNRQEDIAVDDLKELGFDIRFTKEEQMRIEFGGGVTCYPDGLIFSGVPEAPNKIHNFERKTMNTKDFKALKENGCKAVKPEHWFQQQLEMLGWNLKRKQGLDIPPVERSLYLVLCKETSEEYSERIDFDRTQAEFILNRLQLIGASNEMPTSISKDGTWFKCKWCQYHGLCFPKADDPIATPNRNCRTCQLSTPGKDGDFFCCKWKSKIPLENQAKGCRWHCFRPEMIPWLTEDKSLSRDFCSYLFYEDDFGQHGALMGGNPQIGAITSDDFMDRLTKAGVRYGRT